MNNPMFRKLIYRKAVDSDLPAIRALTDFWLAGRGKAQGVPGATNDCFISPSQHAKYIRRYNTQLLFLGSILIGWAVLHPDGTLYHFLIHGEYRGMGVGGWWLGKLQPPTVRSKSNQQSGNPRKFYEKCGYHYKNSVQSRRRLDIDEIAPNRPKTIDILSLPE